MQGILNALVYGMTPAVRKVWSDYLHTVKVPCLANFIQADMTASGEMEMEGSSPMAADDENAA